MASWVVQPPGASRDPTFGISRVGGSICASDGFGSLIGVGSGSVAGVGVVWAAGFRVSGMEDSLNPIFRQISVATGRQA